MCCNTMNCSTLDQNGLNAGSRGVPPLTSAMIPVQLSRFPQAKRSPCLRGVGEEKKFASFLPCN